MFYDVLCIDDFGTASWESVKFQHFDEHNPHFMHGYIERTKLYVKFWEDDSGKNYIGTTYHE